MAAPASATTAVPGAPPVAGGSGPGAAPGALGRIDPRWYSSTLLTLILVIGQWHFQILGSSYVPWLTALGTAVGLDLLIGRIVRGKWVGVLSGYISGNSVAFLVRPAAGAVWPLFLGSAISITSKYALTWRGRHLWNPTNFGVCALLLVAPGQMALLSHEWGNHLGMVAVIWAVGGLTVWRARVWHITLAYLACFALLSWGRSALNGLSLVTELAPVTGPLYQLFMFFMVTDPRTIVRGRRAQLVVVALVALVEAAIRQGVDQGWIGRPLEYAPPMFALFLVGPVAMFLDLRRQPDGRRA